MHIKLFQHPWGDLLSLDNSTDPTSKACNDGARTVVGHLAGNSYKSHSFAQQADIKSISLDRELTQCFSYGFSLCAE